MQDVVFTGPAPRKVSRDLMVAACGTAGIKVRSSFCSKTRTVVAPYEWVKGDRETSKLKKAREQGCEIVSYYRFIAENDLADLVF